MDNARHRPCVQIGRLFNRLREPILRSAIQALQLPSGSWGLDAGCGTGLQALLLAETVGPAGHITGLDLSPEILVYARDIVKKAGLSERITFREGDVNKLPFDDDTFVCGLCIQATTTLGRSGRIGPRGGSNNP